MSDITIESTNTRIEYKAECSFDPPRRLNLRYADRGNEVSIEGLRATWLPDELTGEWVLDRVYVVFRRVTKSGKPYESFRPSTDLVAKQEWQLFTDAIRAMQPRSNITLTPVEGASS